MQIRPTLQWNRRTLAILALSILSVILFSLGCLLSYQKLRDERQDQERAEAQRMLLAFEAHSIRLFDYADGQLRAIRAYMNEHGNTEKLANFIYEIKAPRAEHFTGIVQILDRDGWIVYESETPRGQIKALGKMTGLDYHQYFITHPGDSLFVGATRRDRITGKMQYCLGRPIFKNGIFDGLVLLMLLPEHITDFYSSTSLGLHSTVTMLTQEQLLIARQPDASPWMYGRNKLFTLLKTQGRSTPGQGGSVFGFVSVFDQIRRDMFYRNLADYPVTLIIGIAEQDRDGALAGLRRDLNLRAAAFGLFAILICTLILRLISQNQRLATTEISSQHSLSELRRLSEHLLTAKESERKRIAQDIHDDLGQNLLALKMDVETLYARTGDAHPKLNQCTSLALNNINATIHSVKSIINDLRPTTLELGLIAAIEWQLKKFMQTNGIACNLVQIKEAELDLNDNSSLAIFRIFQESLNNIARHAQATKVEVTLHRDEHGFSMTIQDNGKGIAPDDKKKPGSFGLMGIKERTYALNAEFVIESSPGNGTTLSIFIPMEKDSTNERQIIRPAVRSLTSDATIL